MSKQTLFTPNGVPATKRSDRERRHAANLERQLDEKLRQNCIGLARKKGIKIGRF